MPSCTDPFTLQYVAGHDNIKTTMRYVHPGGCRPQAVGAAGGFAADGGAHRVQEVGAKSGAVGNTLTGLTC
ncbi:hypothetical protein SBA1_460088 [Candidatus Sulfotelmatobacter kueseliae]|uniref:Uncharacterized protein n=1 Tax=Candidatus Sulfotelmatobacter kueseliae TaxID=2042962 RepID=A0A2U3KS68_9BACT|nr:hypothetical protein SBA1_460088 [Candidatus Sulfotelmatobacter kueseliae]